MATADMLVKLGKSRTGAGVEGGEGDGGQYFDRVWWSDWVWEGGGISTASRYHTLSQPGLIH